MGGNLEFYFDYGSPTTNVAYSPRHFGQDRLPYVEELMRS